MTTHSIFDDVRTQIAGISVHEIVQQFGTPTYVYDGAMIVQRIRDLAAFDTVRYAQKACSNIAVLALARQHGVVLDAVSAGEIERALAAGYTATGDGHPIVYTADIFDADALDLVERHGVHVNCGSIDMIAQYGERIGAGEITIRVNPGFGHGHSQKTNTGGEHSKHGIWHEQIPQVMEVAARYGIRVTGVHAHIGSGTDMAHLSTVCEAVEAIAQRVGDTVDTISAGGGLPIRYRPDDPGVDIDSYYTLWDATRTRLAETFGHPVRMEIEPGRYIAAESGSLIAEIRAIKTTPAHTFYLLDAGFNNLARPVMYGAEHPMALVPASGDGKDRPRCDAVIGGPLCESGDIFTQGEGGFVRTQPLPHAEIGEHVVIGCAGAYGAVMSSNYNSKPFAAEVLILDGVMHEVRSRQTLADVMRGESIPAALRD